MKKKMSLDETWRLCLSMWRWIAKERRGGNKSSVSSLKRKWLSLHQMKASEWESENCFFCLYNNKRTLCGCKLCPAIKIDPDFHCADDGHHWRRKPIKFYNKLVSLNRKRLKGKK